MIISGKIKIIRRFKYKGVCFNIYKHIGISKYNVEEVKKQFSFNRYILTLLYPKASGKPPKGCEGYAFVIYDRTKKDEIERVNLDDDDYGDIRIIERMGYFAPTKEQKSQIEKLMYNYYTDSIHPLASRIPVISTIMKLWYFTRVLFAEHLFLITSLGIIMGLIAFFLEIIAFFLEINNHFMIEKLCQH